MADGVDENLNHAEDGLYASDNRNEKNGKNGKTVPTRNDRDGLISYQPKGS